MKIIQHGRPELEKENTRLGNSTTTFIANANAPNVENTQTK